MEKISYLDLIRSRYTDLVRNDEVYTGILESVANVLEEKQDELININDVLLNIEKSSGNLLDIIGRIVGQPRILINFYSKPYFGFFGATNVRSFGTIEDDEVGGFWRSKYDDTGGSAFIADDVIYRKLIKARIIKNSSNATVNDLLKVVNILTDKEDSRVFAQEESGRALLVLTSPINSLTSYFTGRINTDDNILPIPLGVRLDVQTIGNQ